MSVALGPARSIVARKAALHRVPQWNELFNGDAPVVSEDEKLVVFGPFFETTTIEARLTERGLVYWDDFFDLDYSGGTVPDWCQVELSERT